MVSTRRLFLSAASACALLLAAAPLAAAAPVPSFTPDAWYQPAAAGAGTIYPGPVGGAGTSGGTVIVTWGSAPTGGGSGSTATGGAGGGASAAVGSPSSSGGGSGGSTGGSTAPAAPPSGTAGASGAAAQIEAWTNATRAQHGLPPLADSALLDKIATLKCQDMIQNNYFGHDSPTYGTPLQMQQAFGVQARIMGAENLAGARTAALAWFMLVHSPDHLANILYNGLTDQGAAVVPYGVYGVYVCQEFIGN